MNTVYLNGEYKPLAEANVSVMDRGFLFGDGVYEVIPVYSGQPFRLVEHLQRLRSNLELVRIDNPHTDAEWRDILACIIAGASFEDQQVYIQVTRGAAAVRNHAFPADTRPTVLVMTERMTTPDETLRAKGVAAVSATDIRWLRCNIKVTSLLANCMLRQRAVDAGCAETVLFRDGLLTEGAASNIFIVKGGVLLAPPKNHLMLPGITYDVVLELAAAHSLLFEVREIAEAEVRAADEILMTSSTREVLAIVNLDNKPIADGKPGQVAAKLGDWYQEFKRTGMRGGQVMTLLEFPCDFPIKIMGSNVEELEPAVIALVRTYAPDFNPDTMETRPSSKGNYMSLTCTVHATSQEQLDDLYRALTSHPLVKVVL